MTSTRRLAASLAFALSTCLAHAQTNVNVPDDMPSVGTCSNQPFSAGAFTYVARTPASFFTPGSNYVLDIAFAPCLGANLIGTSMQMGVGHLPPNLVGPIAFPTFNAQGVVTSLGSFLDYSPVWNTVAQGTFMYPLTPLNAWKNMNLPKPSGYLFQWDGINDVGFFFTGGASPVAAISTFHRSAAADPVRWYAPTFHAAVSTATDSLGLKMRFVTSSVPAAGAAAFGTGCPGTNAVVPVLGYTGGVPSLGNASFTPDVMLAISGAPTFLFAALGHNQPPIAVGGGCIVYLDLSSLAFLNQTGLFPMGPNYATLAGEAPFPIPVPNDPQLLGLAISFQALVYDQGNPLGITLTNALDCHVGN